MQVHIYISQQYNGYDLYFHIMCYNRGFLGKSFIEV